MDILYVILTALLVVAAVTMILKKVDTRLTFLFLGVIGLAAATIVTGQSVLGDSTTGNVWLDIFDVIRAKFVSTISGTGIRLMMIGGYVMLMNHTKAADVLALGASKLLKPIKNPYIVLALVYMIGAVLKIFITSQIALGLLFMATMFPILTRMGVSKLSAAAACVAIGGMDLGPQRLHRHLCRHRDPKLHPYGLVYQLRADHWTGDHRLRRHFHGHLVPVYG